ncbi:hypothetical protein M3Y94_00632700 [Aphelenchoides besseyi]|nr:hypothetical protein M3Y94_00632700 [Aphelenchoides besseyi]
MKHIVLQTHRFYDHITTRLPNRNPKDDRTGFHNIITRKDISKEKIEQQIQRWAVMMRGKWPQVARGLQVSLTNKLKARKAEIEKLQRSAEAKTFLRKDAAITFNAKTTWIQTCREHNDLVRQQSEKVINELKLYVNSYCLDDAEIANIHARKQLGYQLAAMPLIYNNYFTRYFHVYTTALKGKKRSQVLSIIGNQKLTIGQVKSELEKWAKRNGETKLHEKLLAYLKALKQRRLDARQKYSKEGKELKMKELELHFTDSLTLIDMCKKKNLNVINFGVKTAKEVSEGLNAWCFGNGQFDLRAASASRRGVVETRRYEYVVNRPLPATYYNQFLLKLRGQPLAKARRILQNRRLTKRQISIEFQKLAKNLGSDVEKTYKQTVELETKRRKQVETQRLPRVQNLSSEAKNLSQLEIQIIFNDDLSLYDQCVQKNKLLDEFGDEVANEVGLAVNLWCSSDKEDGEVGGDESESETDGGQTKSHTDKQSQKVVTEDEGGDRLIKVDETYESYSPFLSQLDDSQLSEVELIIRDETLPKGEVLSKLKEWSVEKHMETQYETLVVVMKERTTTTIKTSSKEVQQAQLELKEIEQNHQLTARDSCRRQNELLVKYGDKVAEELGLQANQWCMGEEPPSPVPAPVNECTCDISITDED